MGCQTTENLQAPSTGGVCDVRFSHPALLHDIDLKSRTRGSWGAASGPAGGVCLAAAGHV